MSDSISTVHRQPAIPSGELLLPRSLRPSPGGDGDDGRSAPGVAPGLALVRPPFAHSFAPGSPRRCEVKSININSPRWRFVALVSINEHGLGGGVAMGSSVGCIPATPRTLNTGSNPQGDLLPGGPTPAVPPEGHCPQDSAHPSPLFPAMDLSRRTRPGSNPCCFSLRPRFFNIYRTKRR